MFNPRLFTHLWVAMVFASRSPLLVTEFVTVFPLLVTSAPMVPLLPHRWKASQAFFTLLFLIPTTSYPAIFSFEECLRWFYVDFHLCGYIPSPGLHPPASVLQPSCHPCLPFYTVCRIGSSLMPCCHACPWLSIPDKSFLSLITLN